MAALALFTLLAFLPARPAMASGALIAASNEATAGLDACGTRKSADLYKCVADVLDRLNARIAPINVPETKRALQTAAQELRSATSKTLAMSAIARCQSAISAVIRQERAAGGEAKGLAAVAGVLSRAMRLIQSKG
ncbi:hypothetical protein; putative signal peptide [Bradyrhizobium sp. ORS 278]|nr:hypothetical protein; putative signal peptide [Bradyrhizobium sp. ORS 278]